MITSICSREGSIRMSLNVYTMTQDSIQDPDLVDFVGRLKAKDSGALESLRDQFVLAKDTFEKMGNTVDFSIEGVEPAEGKKSLMMFNGLFLGSLSCQLHFPEVI